MADRKIGLCWIVIMETGLIDLIEIAARHDFPTLSVSPAQYDSCLNAGETDASLRRRLADAGIKVAVVDAVVTGLPGLPEASPPTDAATAFRAAEALGAPVVNVAHYMGKPAPRDELVAGIAQMCRDAAGHGVTLSLEPIAKSAFPDLPGTQALVEECGEPNCGLMFDPTHWSRAGSTVADIAALKPGMIAGFQICDRTIPPPGTRIPPLSGRDLPGEGELPLWDIYDAVMANNPSLTVELEVLSDELKALPPEAAVARCASATKAWLETRPA